MSTNDTDTPTDNTEDALDARKYEIPGYEWERTPADEISEGDLIPGECGEVYELYEKAGHTFNLDATYYTTVIVARGSLSWLGSSNINGEAELTDAVKDRIGTMRIPDNADFIWTVTPTDEN